MPRERKRDEEKERGKKKGKGKKETRILPWRCSLFKTACMPHNAWWWWWLDAFPDEKGIGDSKTGFTPAHGRLEK
jgi:hypothetical protein